MKFRQKIMVYLLLFTALSVTAFAQVVDIRDPNLHSAVRESLNIPPGVPLTRAVILGLTRLDAENRGIVDLTGLEHATELTRLAIPRNQVTDLAPIAALTKLEYLEISVNPISDITPLSNLVNLRRFLRRRLPPYFRHKSSCEPYTTYVGRSQLQHNYGYSASCQLSSTDSFEITRQ